MLNALLAAGLLAGAALGFFLGVRPQLILALIPGSRRPAPAHGHRHSDHGPDHDHGHDHSHPHEEADAAAEAVDLLYPLAAAFFAGFVFSTLVPDALAHSRGTMAAFIGGVVGMAVLSRWILKRDPCCEGVHDHKGLSAVSLAAMAVCSLNDGLLLGLLQPSFGSGLNLGMLLHKITSSFAIAQVLVRGGHRGAGLIAFGIAYSLVSPLALGATALPEVRSLPGLDLILGFSAGILAYVTVASLAPHAGGILRRRPKAIIGFAAALLLSLGIGFWHRALHSHESHEDGGHGAHGPESGHGAHGPHGGGP